MKLHSPGISPYCATFFIFSDYMRCAMRIAALSQAGTIFVMTHDSIGVGEDGPTHQPIEHVASFRAMPGMDMCRPADGNETAGCYKMASRTHERCPDHLGALPPSRAEPSGYLHGRRRQGCVRRPRRRRGRGVRRASSSVPVPSSNSRARLAPSSKQGQEAFASSPCRAGSLRAPIRRLPRVRLAGCHALQRPSPSRRAPRSAGPSTPHKSIGRDDFGASAPAPHPVQGVRHHHGSDGGRREVSHVNSCSVAFRARHCNFLTR